MTISTMQRTYTPPHVCRLAGISYRELDYWIRTGVINVESPHPGSGTARRFTAATVDELKLIRKLRKLGFTLQAIRRRGAASLRDEALLVLE